MQQQDTNELEELMINTTEGLLSFLDYATDTYQQLNEVHTDEEILQRAKKIYDELAITVKRNVIFLEHGQEMSDDEVAAMQASYDQIFSLLDEVVEETVTLPSVEMVLESDQKNGSYTGRLGVTQSVNETLPDILSIRIVQPLATDISPEQTQSAPVLPTPPRFIEHQPLPSQNVRQESVRKTPLSPFVIKVMRDPEYQSFLQQTFASPVSFEAHLRREINVIERPSKLDSVLGIKHTSAFFGILFNKTIRELEEFDAQPSVHIRQILAQKDIPYEVYVQWVREFHLIKDLADRKPNMSFAELFIRAEVEVLLSKLELFS